jgi:hypothetical protein
MTEIIYDVKSMSGPASNKWLLAIKIKLSALRPLNKKKSGKKIERDLK